MGATSARWPARSSSVAPRCRRAAAIKTRAKCSRPETLSDLIFPPGRPPQVERHGDLIAVPIPGLTMLRPEDTARIASDLIGSKEQILKTLQQEGACDLSYSLPERARFRVNVFRQRGSF